MWDGLSSTGGIELVIGWWGAVQGGGPTAGDLLAAQATWEALTRAGWRVGVAAPVEVDVPVPNPVSGEAFHAASALVWVCGPLIAGSRSFRAFFDQFEGRPRFAAGVSVLPKDSPDHFNAFDWCFARDGDGAHFFDLALAALPPDISPRPERSSRIGVCLRGRQREYGAGASAHLEAEIQVGRVLAALPTRSCVLETRLARPTLSPLAIEAAFSSCDLVVTTRLHGALLALRHGVPALAIDQIRGGGKVSAVLERLGWPWVFSIDAEPAALIEAAGRMLRGETAQEVDATRERAVAGARATLDSLAAVLDEWVPRGP